MLIIYALVKKANTLENSEPPVIEGSKQELSHTFVQACETSQNKKQHIHLNSRVKQL